MTPAGLQVPPLASGASAMSVTGPPVAAIFCNLPRAKNPIQRPPGDQNGCRAEVVPESAWDSTDDRSRTYNCAEPASEIPAQTMRRPSGETTGADHKPVSGGSVQLKRVTSVF